MKFESAFCLTNESRAESIFASKSLATIFKVYCTMHKARIRTCHNYLVKSKTSFSVKPVYNGKVFPNIAD